MSTKQKEKGGSVLSSWGKGLVKDPTQVNSFKLIFK